MNFKNKRILITAGPTWVPIDNVRVISNIATGETGILLANSLVEKGARVTLVLGPASACCVDKRIRVVPFKFFDELKIILEQEFRKTQYDAVIHTAAVSDYRPKRIGEKKISSGLKSFNLSLRPTPKIIDAFREKQPQAFIVGFKFEPYATKAGLLKEANKLMRRSGIDIVVANTISHTGCYQAYLLGQRVTLALLPNKSALVRQLVNLLEAKLCRK